MNRIRSSFLNGLGIALLSLSWESTSAMANTLYNQPTDSNGAFASQNDTSGGNGNFATTYDDFTLSSGASVTGLTWVGSYFNPPTQGTITQFTISFYTDNAGQPGTALSSYSITGNATETSLGNDNGGDPEFSYSANLGPGFAAAGGTQYWLSIVPDIGFPPQWGWEIGTGGDGIAYQDYFGARSQLADDLAFSLTGSASGAVPLPLAVYGALPAMLALAFRKRAAR